MTSSSYPAQELRSKAYAWALKLRVNPRVIRVQVMRHKWGSCTSAGTITLAADLSDESARMQDYVIVHELLHLRYPNHGRLFVAMLTTYVPRWRALRQTNTKPKQQTQRADCQQKLFRTTGRLLATSMEVP